MTAYEVVGPVVVLPTVDRSERYLYRGALISEGEFNPAGVEHALSVGLIAEVQLELTEEQLLEEQLRAEAEAERVAAEEAEAERLATEKAEAERLDAERLEAERLEAERKAAGNRQQPKPQQQK